jgi:DNA polymerase-1
MRTSTGISTEAVYIFHNMLRKLQTTFKPGYIAAVFESAGPTFRDAQFAEYKANRTEMPSDLGEQIPYIRRLLEALRIPILQYPGFEADDVIGAIARRAEAAGIEVVIVSSDKDMLQLVTDQVSMLNPMKDDTLYDPAKVQEFMGVRPGQVADLLALKGDSIDNIPGAPGIGEKGARDLVLQFGSVEEALEHAAEVQRKMYRDSLTNHREQILLSKRLATIDTSVPIDWSLDSVVAQPFDPTTLKQIYKELEFFSFLKEMNVEEEAAVQRDYRRLDSDGEVSEYLASMPGGAPCAVVFTDGQHGELEGMEAAQFGLASRTGEGRSFGIEHLEALRPFLEDDSREKIAHDVKSLSVKLCRHGVNPRGFRQDVMLYAFLLSADPSGCACDTLAEKYLDRKLGTSPEQQADCAFALAEKLGAQIEQAGLRQLYETIDLPLVPVLIEMERTGIRIDPEQLKALSVRMDRDIQRLAVEICTLAGKTFNINSPQQLGKILFEDLKLPSPVKYGKGKTISTAADVLETLAETHEIARKVLDYRQLTKLKGTYVDALPALIDRSTGRLHTTFNQAGAATGRLSSSNPNLQNIPIRTELSREIRAAFVPRTGWKLLVADYSQIELRLLAHMSKDPVLVEAFRKGEDIHTRTAAEVFGTPPLMVTPEMRRNAKAVNFGIVYGQTPFGLAAQLGIPRQEAETYIRNYFERYSGVRAFIDRTIEEVRKSGVARTMHGRLRPIPDMLSRNPNARSFAERTAVNTPLQGTAADLIKLAMIRIHRLLEGMQTKMLLQVHDELVFESPESEASEVSRMVKREMEGVASLEVPLLVEVGAGPNWRDAK